MLRELVLAMTLILLGTSVCLAHPYDEVMPLDVHPYYGTDKFSFTADYSINDLTFSSPYGSIESLSRAEQFMLAGGVDNEGVRYKPWYLDVFQIVNLMYEASGTVPDSLSAGVINSFYLTNPVKDNDVSVFDRFKSPITNEFPRLDQMEFAPGQVYMRLLTAEEQDFFARKVEIFDNAWNCGYFYDPVEDTCFPGEVFGGIFYIRVYGEEGVIFETIQYSFRGTGAPVE